MEEGLLHSLKALRTKIAKEKKIPPYLVFSDKTLQDMCHLQPRNGEDFLMVHGVGQKKWENYGPDFLQVISHWSQSEKGTISHV